MHYKFPIIQTIDDVLPAIEGVDEFSVTDKGEYTCINYHLMKTDTFPPVVIESSQADQEAGWVEDYSYYAAIRRECRGIIFDNKTRKIIRRPLHKFFNLNEHEETRLENLNFNDHRFEVKRDGSMIAPFYLRDGICFGTKAGETDVSKPVDEFVARNGRYFDFADDCLQHGCTPIFEWCSRKQRIILDYPEDELVLLAVRDNITGEYVDYSYIAKCYSIPMIEIHKADDHQQFLNEISNMSGIEGFVLTWSNGHKLKIKTAEYVKIHRAKDALSSENKILELYFDNQLDDLLAALSKDEQEAIRAFCDAYEGWLKVTSESVLQSLKNIKDMPRKDFALNFAPLLNSYFRPIYFSCFDDRKIETVKDSLSKMVKKNIGVNIRYSEMKAEVGLPELEL